MQQRYFFPLLNQCCDAMLFSFFINVAKEFSLSLNLCSKGNFPLDLSIKEALLAFYKILPELERLKQSSVLYVLRPLPFPCAGKSEVEGIFPPPYYEWFQYNIIFTEFTGLEECIQYISEYMLRHGPFDALLGFSQGAVLSAALAGLQQKGLALANHPPLSFIVIISGAMFKNKDLVKDCYSNKIKCPSIHLIGNNDWLKPKNEELWKVFEDPLVLRHDAKHTIPRLDENLVNQMKTFLQQLQGEKDEYKSIQEHNNLVQDSVVIEMEVVA